MKALLHHVKTVLLIDDSESEHRIFKEALKQVDPQLYFMWAYDVDNAMEKLNATIAVIPDVIFLDINMPRTNGFQCLQWLKASNKFKDIPVIMYSTSQMQSEINKAKELGAAYFLNKPLYSDLVEVLLLLFKPESEANAHIVNRLLTKCT